MTPSTAESDCFTVETDVVYFPVKPFDSRLNKICFNCLHFPENALQTVVGAELVIPGWCVAFSDSEFDELEAFTSLQDCTVYCEVKILFTN